MALKKNIQLRQGNAETHRRRGLARLAASAAATSMRWELLGFEPALVVVSAGVECPWREAASDDTNEKSVAASAPKKLKVGA